MVDDGPAIRLSSEPGASREDIDGILGPDRRLEHARSPASVTSTRSRSSCATTPARSAAGSRAASGAAGSTSWRCGSTRSCADAGSDGGSSRPRRPRRCAAGAHSAFLETHSFQAPDLYRRLGYEPIAEIEDYPPGGSQLIMRKRLR